MSFEKPNILLLLIFSPMILLLFHYFFLKKERIIKSLFSKENFEKIGIKRSRGKYFLKALFLTITYSLTVIALASPRYGFKDINLLSNGKNIFIAIDTSLSMNAEDVKPSRLKLAKRKVTDLIKLAKGERLALVPFAGEPYMLIPLTNDYTIFTSFLDMVDTDIIPVQGTNFLNLINKVSEIVTEHKLLNVSLLILSDGEDFSGNIEKALKICKENHITIYTLGIGTEHPTPIPLKNGGFKKNKKGNVVTTKLDEKFLEKIALETDGVYIRNSLTSKDIKLLYDKINGKAGKNNRNSIMKRIYFNRFKWFLIPAFISLLLFFIIDDRKYKIIPIFLIFFLSNNLFAANPYFLNKKGIKDYDSKNYIESLKKFDNAFKEDKNMIYLFNKSDSLYKLKRYDNATELLYDIIKKTKNNLLKSKSYFNKGVIEYKNKKFQEALKDFKESLKLNPNDYNARINYEITLKKLREKNNKKNNKKKNENSKKNKNKNKNKSKQQNENKNSQQKNKKEDKKNQTSQKSLKKNSNNSNKRKIDRKILNLYNDNKMLYKKAIKKHFKFKKFKSEKDW